jgi:hypothetical protein
LSLRGIKLIPLTRGLFTIVDVDDFERISIFKWMALRSRNTFYAAKNGSRAGKVKTSMVLMHRTVLVTGDGSSVDHKNRLTLDNRKINLRRCTPSQNAMNRAKCSNALSRYKGVKFDKRWKLWGAAIQVDEKRFSLGGFASEMEAALAYDEAARQHFGEFACLNFPERVVAA